MSRTHTWFTGHGPLPRRIADQELGRAVELGGMPFKTLALTRAARAKGHDRLKVENEFIAVADGATPLEATWPDPGMFAERALTALHHEARLTANAQQMWARSISSTSQWPEYRSQNVSCAVALGRSVQHGLLEFSLLGDCTVHVRLREGAEFTLTDDTVPRRDAAAQESSSDRVQLHERLVANRRQMNSEPGYWIFAGDPRAASHVIAQAFRVRDIDRFLLMTDGGALLRSGSAGEQGWPDVLSAFRSGSPTAFASWLAAVTQSRELDDDIAMVAGWAPT